VTKAQKIILAVSCFLLAYCCVWIPWRVTTSLSQRNVIEITYSFVWRAPSCGCISDNGIDPDMKLIFLRIVAVSAVCGAGFFLVGLVDRKRT
jgi:hypothetical protein